MKLVINSVVILAAVVGLTRAIAQDAIVTVHADQTNQRVSRYLTGACIEDVNHEIYGGIDSQMIFGESFAEPQPQPPLSGFSTFGGKWTVGTDGSIQVLGSDGAKLVWDGPAFAEGEASVDVWLTETAGGNGGFILKVSDPAKGADLFNGYEVSIERPGDAGARQASSQLGTAAPRSVRGAGQSMDYSHSSHDGKDARSAGQRQKRAEIRRHRASA